MSDPSLVACPQCGQIDQVHHVPALYQGGRSTYSSAGPTMGVAGGSLAYGYGVQRGQIISDLAWSLSPPTPERHHGGCGTALAWFFGLGTIGLSMVILVTTAPKTYSSPTEIADSSTGQWFGPVVTAVFTIALIAVNVRAQRNVDRRNTLVPAAVQRWRCGWFCYRCGGVYFPARTGQNLPTGHLMSPDEFRNIVWSNSNRS